MAGLKFSHILLLAALTVWLLALITQLFFPFLAFSATHVPNLLTFLTALFPTVRPDTLAIICFLLAIACAFVAGAVYGMERESEYWASYLGIGQTTETNFADLEKGGLPPYRDEEYPPYKDDEDEKSGAKETYYPSAAENAYAAAQYSASTTYIQRTRTFEQMDLGNLPKGQVIMGSMSGMDPYSGQGVTADDLYVEQVGERYQSVDVRGVEVFTIFEGAVEEEVVFC